MLEIKSSLFQSDLLWYLLGFQKKLARKMETETVLLEASMDQSPPKSNGILGGTPPDTVRK